MKYDYKVNIRNLLEKKNRTLRRKKIRITKEIRKIKAKKSYKKFITISVYFKVSPLPR